MQMPPALLEAIIGHRQIRFGDYHHEKRHDARAEFALRTLLFHLSDRTIRSHAPARVREISRGGLSLLHSADLRPGDVFAARIPRLDDEPIWLECQAVRRQRISPDHCIIGARFDAILGTLKSRDQFITEHDCRYLSHGCCTE